MSTPTAYPGWRVQAGADRAEALGEHARSAAVEQAERLDVALDRHGADDALGARLEDLDPHPVEQIVSDITGQLAMIGRLRCPCCIRLVARSSAARPSMPVGALDTRVRCGRLLRLPVRRLASPPAAARRAFAGLSGVLRAAGRELLHHDRAAHQRRLRLHLDADQRAARRGADPHRGRLRRVAADVPLGGVRRVQGQPVQEPRRVQGPGVAGQGGARRAAGRLASTRTASRPTT